MKRLALVFLALFVASIPLQELFFDQLHGYVGSVPRLFGIAAFILGVVAAALDGRFGVPGRIHLVMILFVGWSMLSVVWSVAPDLTWERNLTFVQIAAMVWLFLQYARTKETVEWMLIAYLAGCLAVVSAVLFNAATGQALGGLSAHTIKYVRFQAFRSDPNELALGLVLAIPMAWYFFSKATGVWRGVALSFIPIAMLGAVLTGSRGGALAMAAALLIVPYTYFRLGRTAKVWVVGGVLAGLALLPAVVPQNTWERVLTLMDVLDNRARFAQMRWTEQNVRVKIWAEGIETFGDNPIFGIGSAAFAEGTRSVEGEHRVAHSVWISTLTELGLIGSAFWVVLVILSFVALRGFSTEERTMWFFILLAWAVGASFLTWEHTKNTWLIFGLIGARDSQLRLEWRAMRRRMRQIAGLRRPVTQGMVPA